MSDHEEDGDLLLVKDFKCRVCKRFFRETDMGIKAVPDCDDGCWTIATAKCCAGCAETDGQYDEDGISKRDPTWVERLGRGVELLWRGESDWPCDNLETFERESIELSAVDWPSDGIVEIMDS